MAEWWIVSQVGLNNLRRAKLYEAMVREGSLDYITKIWPLTMLVCLMSGQFYGPHGPHIHMQLCTSQFPCICILHVILFACRSISGPLIVPDGLQGHFSCISCIGRTACTQVAMIGPSCPYGQNPSCESYNNLHVMLSVCLRNCTTNDWVVFASPEKGEHKELRKL